MTYAINDHGIGARISAEIADSVLRLAGILCVALVPFCGYRVFQFLGSADQLGRGTMPIPHLAMVGLSFLPIVLMFIGRVRSRRNDFCRIGEGLSYTTLVIPFVIGTAMTAFFAFAWALVPVMPFSETVLRDVLAFFWPTFAAMAFMAALAVL